MTEAAKKYWDFYNMVPGAPFFQREFGFYSLDQWRAEEGLAADADLALEFGFDGPGRYDLGGLGGCEAAFAPMFAEEVLEDRGAYELVRDKAGRKVLYFKNRRDGFMPEYVDHPVKDMRTWEELCKWRMNPSSPERQELIDRTLPLAKAKQAEGMFIGQYMVGGYMYLRSLIGPEALLYMFYDDPALIHECMRAWLALADSVLARHQSGVEIDELLFDEDICYNHGPLISPDMIREFLMPYYGTLLENARRRQRRALHLQLATDGFCESVIDLYCEIGMDHMSPFEAASGCDVLRAAKKYPFLRISGGVDKRELARGKEAIDCLVERIYPAMRERGGYIPTCDHGVPAEVSLENYRYFRRRCLEFSK